MKISPKKQLFILSLCSMILFGCKEVPPSTHHTEHKPYEIYQLAVNAGFEGTYEEWLASIKGADGKDGATLLYGNGSPSATSGKDGDSYIDLDTWDFYVKTASGWSKAGNIKGGAGQQGPQGEAGPQGPQGEQGQDAITYIPCIFNNYDGSKIYEFYYEKGTDIIYDGPAPKRPSDWAGTEELPYTFIGWDKPLTNIQNPTIFTAQYRGKMYDVTFNNYDGRQLYTCQIERGRDAVYKGPTPTRPSDWAGAEEIPYTFIGWDFPLENIKRNMAFTAQFRSKMYNVKFVNSDGSLLYACEVERGKEATYNGPWPTKPNQGAGQNETTFAFKGWDKPLANITSNCIFTAQYHSSSISSIAKEAYQRISDPYKEFANGILDNQHLETHCSLDWLNGKYYQFEIGYTIAEQAKNWLSISQSGNNLLVTNGPVDTYLPGALKAELLYEGQVRFTQAHDVKVSSYKKLTDIYNLNKGDAVTTVGKLVRIRDDGNGYHIAVGDHAIYVCTKDALPAGVVVGDTLKVGGTLDIYNGLYELKPNSVEKVTTTVEEPVALDVATVTDLSLKTLQSREAAVNGAYIIKMHGEHKTSSKGGEYELVEADVYVPAANATVLVRAESRKMSAEDFATWGWTYDAATGKGSFSADAPAKGDALTATGFVDFYNGKIQVSGAKFVSKGAFTGEVPNIPAVDLVALAKEAYGLVSATYDAFTQGIGGDQALAKEAKVAGEDGKEYTFQVRYTVAESAKTWLAIAETGDKLIVTQDYEEHTLVKAFKAEVLFDGEVKHTAEHNVRVAKLVKLANIYNLNKGDAVTTVGKLVRIHDEVPR